MTRNEELALVIGLACMIEDRTDAEQRALIKLAWDCDVAHNRNTIGNRARQAANFELQDLVTEVDRSRVLQEKQRPVGKPNRWAERWKMWEEGR